METVEFQRDKNAERDHRRFLSSEDEGKELNLLQKAGIGAAATAGALAVGYRTGAMRRVSRFLTDEFSTLRQATRETLDTETPLRKDLSLRNLKETGSSINKRRTELLREIREEKNPLAKREFDMERYLRQRRQLLEDDVPEHISEGLRFRSVMQEVRQSDLVDAKLGDRIERSLNKGYTGMLKFGSDTDIKKLLIEDDIRGEDIFDVIAKAKANNKSRDFSSRSEEGKMWIDNIQEKLRKQTAKNIQDITKSDGLIGRTIKGDRQATIEDVLELHKNKQIKISEETASDIQDVLKYNKSFKDAVFDENLYTQVKDGKVVGVKDYGAIRDLKEGVTEWFSHTMPGGLFFFRDQINMRVAKETASFRVFERGTVQPLLNGHLDVKSNQALSDELVFINGKFVKLFDSKAINENTDLTVLNPNRDMYLTSSRYGNAAIMARQMTGTMTDNKRAFLGMDITNSRIAKTLDFGGQEKSPDGTENFSVFSKFFDKDWDRKKISNLLKEGFSEPDQVYDMQRFFDQNPGNVSTRVLNQIKSHLPDNIVKKTEGINFSNDDDILDFFTKLGSDRDIETSFKFNRLYHDYIRNSDEVLGRTTPRGQTNIILGGRVEVTTGMDEIKQAVGSELFKQITEVKPNAMISVREAQDGLRNFLQKQQKEGNILKRELQDAEVLINQQMFEQARKNVRVGFDKHYTDLDQLFTGTEEADRAFQKSLKQMSSRINPLLEKNTNAGHFNQIRDEYIAVNKANIFENLQSKEGIADLFKQMDLRTGRRNTEDVTTLSLFGSYFPAYRLQDALNAVGLGFSDKSMESPLQIWSSLALKRGLPIYGGYEAYHYMDHLVEKHTDASLDQRWEIHKANKRIEAAERRDELGQTDRLQRERLLKPGIEHFEAMPSIHLPLIGDIGPGNFINTALGLITGSAVHREADAMTVEETIDDILYGTEEIRKGRWWAFGSRTPYRGDQIIENAPNSYRLAMARTRYSDVTSSSDEKYSHSFLPTIENPLGGLAFLLGTRDPYWFEKKHYYDRPYLLTGDLFNSNTMLLGDIGNMTVGEILKPTREMHSEYWEDPEQVFRDSEQLGQRPQAPVETIISPAGRVQHFVNATPTDYGATGYIPNQYGGSEESGYTPNEVRYSEEEMGQEYAPIRGEKTSQSYHEHRHAIPSENVIATTPRGLYEDNIPYYREMAMEQIKNMRDPRSMSWKLEEMANNWMEPHGVYYWMFMDEMLGYDDKHVGETVIQKASDSYNASGKFWEMELGSLGDYLSEIGRRFLRRDGGQMNKYNPVRNQMEEWLPGDNYFINFQEGDPYGKVPHGEYRLPGEAYERLNPLHSDETGRYGAFDKFKILADVAPWSEEYVYWRDYVTEYLEDKDLRKEVAEIKRQVSRRKERHDFQDYIFKTADVSKYKVTVRRFLDDYTFLTEEFGDQPIRMAGVDSRANAEGILQKYFNVGDQVTIGVDSDINRRIQNDTYGTMRAVVFDGIESINKKIIERGEMKEQETDVTAAGVWARFSPSEIAKGSRWESIAHFESALNTKFLPVRTALEEYERNQIYLKDWSTWDNFGISDYGIPAIERMAGRDSILMATFSGGMFGGFVGRMFFGGGKRTLGGAALGALTGTAVNLSAKAYQAKTGEKWIPERRRTEHDINEYFDVLKFMKYRGLYEKAKTEIAHLGYDPDGFIQNIEEKKERNKTARRELEAEKKELYIKQPKNWEDRRKEINQELKRISEDWDKVQLPPEVAQALYYKEESEKTLYGADPYDDRMKLMQAFPYKDRSFFNEFVDARTADREKILELVPENQRRIYKALWGEGLEGRKPLSYYYEKYNIPDADWAGWMPEYSLEDIKVKTVIKEGLDLSDFNYWEDDIQASRHTPDLPMDYNDKGPRFKGYKDVEQNIRAVLEGQGLRNVSVVVTPSNGGQTHTQFRYTEDRQQEIENELRYNIQNYT